MAVANEILRQRKRESERRIEKTKKDEVGGSNRTRFLFSNIFPPLCAFLTSRYRARVPAVHHRNLQSIGSLSCPNASEDEKRRDQLCIRQKLIECKWRTKMCGNKTPALHRRFFARNCPRTGREISAIWHFEGSCSPRML